MVAEQGLEPLPGEADDVGDAPPDDVDERVAILDAVGPRLPLPTARVEVDPALVVLEPTEPDDARLDGADPFGPPGVIEAEAGQDRAVAPLLEPDHPLGVVAIGRLVEDGAPHGADGVGGEDQAVAASEGH